MKKLVLLSVMFLVGCASTYSGPLPDYSLKGPAAEREYRQFKFRERDFWNDDLGSFAMGPNETRYTVNSLMPVISDVSPAAVNQIKKENTYQALAWIPIAAALYMIPQMNYTNASELQTYYGLLFGSLGLSLYAFHVHGDAIDDYNRDLRSKLTPTVSVSHQF